MAMDRDFSLLSGGGGADGEGDADEEAEWAAGCAAAFPAGSLASVAQQACALRLHCVCTACALRVHCAACIAGGGTGASRAPAAQPACLRLGADPPAMRQVPEQGAGRRV